MRATHKLFPTVPLFVVAKEISLEDVRLGLEKLPDRLFEHPATVFVVTNLNYARGAAADAARCPGRRGLELAGSAAHGHDGA